jgi:hypothetical protein
MWRQGEKEVSRKICAVLRLSRPVQGMAKYSSPANRRALIALDRTNVALPLFRGGGIGVPQIDLMVSIDGLPRPSASPCPRLGGEREGLILDGHSADSLEVRNDDVTVIPLSAWQWHFRLAGPARTLTRGLPLLQSTGRSREFRQGTGMPTPLQRRG